MKNMKLAVLYLLLIAMIIGGAVSCKYRVSRQLVKKKCVECHQKKVDEFKKAGVVHKPVKGNECESCHLKVSEKELCYTCHKDMKSMLDKKHLHAPAKERECISCHSPHSSENKNLLKGKGNNLCFICHKENAYSRKMQQKPFRL